MSINLCKHLILATAAAIALISQAQAADDPQACKTVHFSDVGWSCITATTALASELLTAMGYEPKTSVLSVPVTFESLSNSDIDAFIGLWLPSQQSMIQPYFDKSSIDNVAVNLEGAKYTLAVPKYVSDAGVKNFADLAANKDKFDGKIYGIEPGNDGNLIIQSLIDKNAFDLGDWELVESSEQGMLSQVKRAVNRDQWIVFLGWAPHPMNRAVEMDYLAGGDDYFGPDFGGATVHTLTRKGYLEACPNAGKLVQNLKFSMDSENEIMSYMLDDGMDPAAAAKKLIENHPDMLEQWLNGITTLDGSKDALSAVKTELGM
jgi:glycine betaine/proline transport system substrate-binding protein